jgi:ketose-bisphosphate aldolase
MMEKRSLKDYFGKARKEGWALTQFNVSCPEQLQGVVEAGVNMKAPLLIGTSEGDTSFFTTHQAVNLVSFWRKETGLPIFLNFDHGRSFEMLKEAAAAGYDALHFDGSALPLEENISIAKKVVVMARKHGISVVEGEFGEMPGGHSDLHNMETPVLTEKDYTNSHDAADFVKKTGVDSLAVMIGTLHGIFKTTQPLNIQRLQEINSRGISFLVLHGGSGTPEGDLQEAIKNGIVKVNVSTDLRVAFTSTLRETLAKNLKEIAPYHILPPVVEAVRRVAEHTIILMGSSNKI